MKKIILLFTLFTITVAFSQKKEVTGLVTSAPNNEVLAGVTVLLKGTNIGTTTDFDGNFSIKAASGGTLVFSYVGFKSVSVVVGDENIYNTTLEEDYDNLEEVVVTGYSKEKKKDINGAISIVNVDELKSVSTPNVVSKLQSKVPGLSFTSSGVPGGSDVQISIRGLTSVYGGTGPLWVIDGVQTTTPAGLNPNDVESIQVLKDAASAGIYGTEAARGVIIVTTKQAKIGTQKFALDARFSANTIRDNFNVLGSQDWLDVRYKAQGDVPVSVGDFVYTPGTPLPEYLDANQNLRTSNTNWIDEITSNSFSMTTDFSYSYANERWKVFTGLGYAKDDGIIEHTYYNRTNFRLNTSVDVFKDKRLIIGENLNVTNFNEVKGNSMEDALLQNPLIPVYAEDGTWGGPVAGLQDKWNPLAILNNNKDNVQETWRTFGNFFADVKIIEGLVFSTKFNFDINRFSFDEKTGAFDQNGSILGNMIILDGEQYSRFSRNRNDINAYVFTNLLSYNREFDKHTLDAFVGYEVATKDQVNDFYRVQVPFGTDVDYDNIEDYDVINDSSSLDAYGIGADSSRESIFLKASWNYESKYFATASVRRDGSSRFGENNRYATFPTASAGWTLSNEDWLKDSEFVSNLKLRASWGGNGNADILEYAQYSIFNNSLENSNYDLLGGGNGAIGIGVSPNQVGNPDLKWEQSYQTNIGLDATLWKNHVNIAFDIYKKTTSDLLLQTVQPSSLGEAGGTLFYNAGDMENKGLEVLLSYNTYSSKDFQFGADLTFSTYTNEVTKLNNPDDFILNGVSYTSVGNPIGSYYGYVADGIFRTPEEVAVHANQTGKALGNIRYRDLNGDGQINQDDRTVIGNPHPDFIYGINLKGSYKNWDLNVFFDGKQGNDMYNAQRELLDFAYFGFNHGVNTLDAWQSDNANSLIPALSTADTNDQKRASTYFVEDGSYFRLKSINLNYNFKEKFMDKLKLSSGNVFFQAENILTVTSFSGFDYEVPGLGRTGIGIAGMGVYPHTKTFSIGFNLQF